MNHPKIGYTAKYMIGDVLKANEVERERFKEWSMKGFVESSEKVKQGKRTLHLYTKLDIYRIGLFKHLVEEGGLSRADASAVSKEWKKVAIKTPNCFVDSYSYLVFFRIGDRFEFAQHSDLIVSGPEYQELKWGLMWEEVKKAIRDYPNFNTMTVLNFGKIRDKIDERLKQAG